MTNECLVLLGGYPALVAAGVALWRALQKSQDDRLRESQHYEKSLREILNKVKNRKRGK